MTPELEQQLKSIVSFPSPPGVATHIIELAQDPNIEMGKVAKAVSMDPALTSKVLRIANSAMYAQRRRSENLRQALVVLGLNATLTLALSFSLVKVLKDGKPNGIDYPRYWRRALLSGMAARSLGEAAGQGIAEDLFLAGLLQDIGVLALDRAIPDLYRDTAGAQLTHRELVLHERRRLGCDHADVGAWLMRQWNLAERLWKSIQSSHRLDTRRVLDADEAFNRCVALSGPVADLFLYSDTDCSDEINEFAQQADRVLGLDKEACARVLQRISLLVPETESIFETDITTDSDAIIEQAREILMVRNLLTLREMNSLRVAADSLSARTMELEAETRRDSLTGVFNRSFLEQHLAREFDNATRQGWPISVAFCDLDHFKKINDTYGHQAGDAVLQATARILRSNTRESDVVARYGGEEFVLVLPTADADTCHSICERIITACQHMRHDALAAGITVTLSIGFATHSTDTPFDSVESLLRSADAALYTAKLQGRNRAVRFEPAQPKAAVRFV